MVSLFICFNNSSFLLKVAFWSCINISWMERLGYSLLAHSVITPFKIKGSVVNYDNVNMRTAEIKRTLCFLSHRKQRFLLQNYQSFHFSDVSWHLGLSSYLSPKSVRKYFWVLLLFDQRHLCKWYLFLSFSNISLTPKVPHT